MSRNSRKAIQGRWLLCIAVLWLFFIYPQVRAQDRLPVPSPTEKRLRMPKLLQELHRANDTIISVCPLPAAFRGIQPNELGGHVEALYPVLEHLRLLRMGGSDDTIRIVHIGDSHVRGHIYPQTTGALLTETFDAVSYIDKGVNGATCLTFTHPDRVAEIVALKPELLILSFSTNESHNRRYNPHLHYNQMDELVKLLRDSLPHTPILLTTPPGSYESFRQRRRRRTYAVNPRTATAAEVIVRYASEHGMPVWDMYRAVGGKRRACLNWNEARLMRPDHVHYLPEGYVLQGNLLYQALIKAYNNYVSN